MGKGRILRLAAQSGPLDYRVVGEVPQRKGCQVVKTQRCLLLLSILFFFSKWFSNGLEVFFIILLLNGFCIVD